MLLTLKFEGRVLFSIISTRSLLQNDNVLCSNFIKYRVLNVKNLSHDEITKTNQISSKMTNFEVFIEGTYRSNDRKIWSL